MAESAEQQEGTMDAEIQDIIRKAKRGLPKQVGNYPVELIIDIAIRAVAKRFAEIADTEWDRNEGSAANAILRAAGLEGREP